MRERGRLTSHYVCWKALYGFDFGRDSFCDDFFKVRKMVVGAGQVCKTELFG